MASLQVRNDCPSFSVSEKGLARYFDRLVAALKLGASAQAAVTFVGPRRIASLKKQHFGVAMETDCIAFSTDMGTMPGGVRLLGDMFFCPHVIEKNARELDRPFDTEAHFVFTHGVLHLLGWDDGTPAERQAMYRKQESLMKRCRAGRVFGRVAR